MWPGNEAGVGARDQNIKVQEVSVVVVGWKVEEVDRNFFFSFPFVGSSILVMDGLKSQAKLTRNHSSLLRSSPTIRSSIHSLSSVNELIADQDGYGGDIEEQKPHSKPGLNPTSVRRRSGSSRFASIVLLTLLSVCTLFLFFNKDDIPTSENVLLVLIFIAVLLFFIQRNKDLIYDRFNVLKQLYDQHAKRRLGFSKNQTKPVKWFIGESNLDGIKERKHREQKKIIREGVEFYSNGDFYEGEFHKGRCTGSGVYNYFANGRYEGDWIDGRYDGYGIESWARGSRYRGQYKQGLRHGYGVYRFYTGDTYAGQWCNGQSHGLGVQTCSDGSCYIGEFKAGVKHGLGAYQFR